MNVQDTNKIQLKELVKAFKGKRYKDLSTNILSPYKKDIYQLRYKKQANLEDIRLIFKEIGINVSKKSISDFCKQTFSN